MKKVKNKNFLSTNLFRNLFHGSQAHTNMSLFAVEGVMIALINNLVGNNNNLFATRLGASDFQLSLVTALPQFLGMLVLIPGGMFTDSMNNKKKMVSLSLVSIGVTYFLLGFTPALGGYSFLAFLLLLTISVGPMTIYNTSWQAYFSDVTPTGDRNKSFTLRTKWTFLVNLLVPIITGNLLASANTTAAKLKFHQGFLWCACITIIIQIFILNKIKGGNAKVEARTKVSLSEIKNAAICLAHNRSFIGFAAVALFFYMTWQSDWTLYYLGQIKYLKLNEAWLGYVTVGGAAVQFLTIGYWSRVNEKHGVRFSIIMGALGLCFFPIIMIVSTSLPASIAPTVFLIFNIIANFAFATVSLNILQCLLQVVPEKNKTLSIAIYTVLITFSNAVMPMVGVKVYTLLGADLHALQLTFLIIFVSRIVSTLLWTLRWWLLKE
ncbi:MFS transporter [Clostridium oryzae]|uniref:Major facilitator superfamily protein n=1 Tax=Clostridium oryzae TaxID=1450648 RepID=A0A1V4IDE0_9CLOT|nr:MFS transporter [Clostridium oryzae]OPJ57900.1 major facilitator superfamily protein [Clostridium oryzae]